MEKCLVHPCLVPVWTKPWWLEVEESKELSIPVSSRCLLLGLNGSGTLAVLAGVANMFSHVLMSTIFLNGKLTLNAIVHYPWFEWTLARYLYGWIRTQLLYITVQCKCTCMLAKDYMQLTFITCWRSREFGLQVHSGTWVPAIFWSNPSQEDHFSTSKANPPCSTSLQVRLLERWTGLSEQWKRGVCEFIFALAQ